MTNETVIDTNEATHEDDHGRCALMTQIMLACYYSSLPWLEVQSWNSYAGRRIRNTLYKHGMIDAFHETTEKGKAWVKYINEVPFPSEMTTWKVEV